MTTRIGAVLGLTIALGGCTREPVHEYPTEVVENFLAACRQRAPDDSCQCAIDRLRDTYPYEEYERLDRQMRQGEVPPEVADLIRGCEHA